MKNSIIKLPAGLYSNEDVYERVLYYVSHKDYIGGYAIFPPFNTDYIVKQFQISEDTSFYSSERKIWHFIISVSNIRSHQNLLLLAERIAFLFSYNYQVLYALDLETGKYHLHFAVNAYSYHPKTEPLSDFLFLQYVEKIKVILSETFPNHPICFINENKGGSNDV